MKAKPKTRWLWCLGLGRSMDENIRLKKLVEQLKAQVLVLKMSNEYLLKLCRELIGQRY